MNVKKNQHRTAIAALLADLKTARVKTIATDDGEHLAYSAAEVALGLRSLEWADEEDIRDANELATNLSDRATVEGYSQGVILDTTNLVNDLQKIIDSLK